MSKTMQAKRSQAKLGGNFSVVSAFILLFIYGSLLLMIGYTSGGLDKVLSIKSSQVIYFAIPQSIGLIASTLSLKFLLSKFNTRTILSSAYASTIVLLVLISQFDLISGGTTNNVANNITVARALFIIFTFLFGWCIGYSSPIVSTFLSAIYTGKKRSTMISVSNGIYGVGAGIIPLVASEALYGSNSKLSKNVGFDSVRYFYYIAIGLAIFAFISALFIDYRHSEQNLSSGIIHNKKQKTTRNFSIYIPLILMLTVMFFYMMTETFSNYAFTTFVTSSGAGNASDHPSSLKITAFQAFGFFLVVQGLVRCGSGLTITKWIHNKTYIVFSAIFIIIAYIMISAGILKISAGFAYLIALIIGIGLGNSWPMIFSYAVGMDSRRNTFIGIWVNIISMASIPIGQLIAAGLLVGATSASQSQYYILPIIGVVAGVGIIAFTIITAYYLIHKNIKHEDEVNPSTFELWYANRAKKS